MRLKSIKIENFRAIECETIDVVEITRIIGANGAGKSTILKALELFYYRGTPFITIDDVFERSSEKEISITLTFFSLSAAEKDRFQSQVKSDGTMAVARIFNLGEKSTGKYYGTARRHPGFSGVRATSGARDKQAAYKALSEKYGLPAVTRADAIEPALSEWEAQNPKHCEEMRDDGQFFGFTNVAAGMLADCTSLVYVPAVRDAAQDAQDERKSVIAELLSLIVRSAIEQRQDIKDFRDKITNEFNVLMDPNNLPELGKFSQTLSSTLSRYYPGTSVDMAWREAQAVSIQFPAADMRLNDDGFITSVDRTGHGLQRALIMTLLEHLAIAGRQQAEPTAKEEKFVEPAPAPNLILAIEEPELYQHPTKQRHMATVLEKLGAGTIPGVSNHIQVVFTTHSPHFISVERFDEVRLVRRWRGAENGQRACRISSTNLHEIVADISVAFKSDKYTIEGLKPKLHVVDNSVCDAFFARVVVVVEGVSDKAALEAAALQRKIDLTAEEIAIVPVNGKGSIDKIVIIFRRLGIPVFAIWDCDRGGDNPAVNINKALLRLFNVQENDIIDYCSRLGKEFLCFEKTLEDQVKIDLGEKLWNEILTALREEYGVQNRADAQKVPRIMLELLNRAASSGRTSATLDAVINAILALKPLPPEASV